MVSIQERVMMARVRYTVGFTWSKNDFSTVRSKGTYLILIDFFLLNRDDMKMVCRNLTPNLIKLSLAGCRDKLLDDDVYELVNRCNRLLELDLSDASAISNKAVTHIVQFLSGTLRKLSLSRCFDIHPAKFLEVNTMPQLKNLNIFGMLLPHKLEILKKQLPHLSVNEDHLCYIARSATGDKKNQLWDARLWQ